jgi:hypothetical protein
MPMNRPARQQSGMLRPIKCAMIGLIYFFNRYKNQKLRIIHAYFRKNSSNEFASIALLIEEARYRAFQKVNEELVLLYFKVGNIVSEKVTAGAWGSGTVDELAKYIAFRLPGLTGFNERGLYRMKQFYETYSVEQFVSPLASLLEKTLESKNPIVSAVPTQLKISKRDDGDMLYKGERHRSS